MAEGNAPGTIRKSERLRKISGVNYSSDQSLAIDIAIEQDLIASATNLNAAAKKKIFVGIPSPKAQRVSKKVKDRASTPKSKLKQTTLKALTARSPLRRSATVSNLSLGSDSDDSFVTADFDSSYKRSQSSLSVNASRESARNRDHINTEGNKNRRSDQKNVESHKMSEDTAPSWFDQLMKKMDEVKLDLKKEILEGKIETEKKIKEVTETKADKATVEKVSKELFENKQMCRLQYSQIKELTGAVIRQEQEIHECKQEIERLHSMFIKRQLSIEGLGIEDDNSPSEQAQIFFQTIMKIEVEIRIRSAYQTGKEQKPVIHIDLLNPADKGEIFKKAANLSGIKNKYGKYYRLRDYRSSKVREEKKKMKTLMKSNKEKPKGLQVKMEVQKGKLIIGSGNSAKEFKNPIHVPKCKDVLLPTKQELETRSQVDITQGEIFEFEGQQFIGFSAIVDSIESAQIAYRKIKASHMDARHIFCAVRLPGSEVHNNEVYHDDDEHGGGKVLLDMLKDSGIFYRAIYVARKYDGTHIKDQRWVESEKALASVVNRSAQNKFTNEHQMIWLKHRAEQQKRGHASYRDVAIRGGSPRLRGTGVVKPPGASAQVAPSAAGMTNHVHPSAHGPEVNSHITDNGVEEDEQEEDEESQTSENEYQESAGIQ